ncbi:MULTISPECIES: ABC transporter ATP-binding protein [unclassified Oceanispirochaeta]|uniref:ABC transporter ATP-binding protein n=1 Tax=unclassified Oceanispirochaeta TaxID=2635722 RepID=UPI000E090523|nr:MULTISPECIES: ABC transporter ATP-binding protein [unclassified Oceanispirochaeta]MBF9017952.1 ABC transporter ATP-binding protein [Oceanispirochaeta sp. M2]NPD74463.1 ABC transporter ATP-binding protein [Oceanispirochaeta sp. M1]RDG29672.1 ABC transporter ATP-binding protein [Oceanispirochaeta sp. M1]
MSNAIEITGLRYSYPKNDSPTLDGVDLQIPEGAFTIITGPTGAGKTTLVFSMNGIVPELTEGRIAGKIQVFDKNVRKTRVQDLLGSIGVVMQDPETQIFGRTVEEDTEFGPRNMMLSREDIRERVDKSLSMVRLDHFHKRQSDQLSGGEKQRLAIAGILAMKPKMIVLDEPTSELDPLGRSEIYKTIQDLRQRENMTIVGVEHATQDIIDFADHLVVMRLGKIVWQGVPSALLRDIEKSRALGIKPIPVSLLGLSLAQAGLADIHDIPLSLDEAEKLVRQIISKRMKADPDYQASALFREEPLKISASGKILLEIKGLTHIYKGGVQALKGVDLIIREGEFVALIGQNGAGKTTLAKHLNGLLQPSEGDILVLGKNTRITPINELAKDIGYVFQNPDHQIFSVTVEQEIQYGLQNMDLSDEEITERVNEIAEITGLEPALQEHPLSLGKGQRQMVAVASILAMKPRILVIDEPTTGQDWEGIQNMMTLIKGLHSKGTTIIMISHDMDIVSEYADRVVVLTQGEIRADGTGEDVFKKNTVLREACVTAPQIPLLCERLEDVLDGLCIMSPEKLAETIVGYRRSI